MKDKRPPRIPKMRLHKATGQACVELNSRVIYLGAHGTPEAQQRYDRAVAEWLARDRKPVVSDREITILELRARYLEHAASYYRGADGAPTSEYSIAKGATKRLQDHYEMEPAAEFGPLKLAAVRASWIHDKLTRTTINKYTKHLRRMFKWATAQELIPPAAYQALVSLDGLRAGRTEAKEPREIGPVPVDDVEKAKAHLTPTLRDLVDLQLLTGARPGELLSLRPVDIDATGIVWSVELKNHKTAYSGKTRTLYFGPQAQAILRRRMADIAVDAYLFSPHDAIIEFRTGKATKDKARRADQPDTRRETARRVGDTYDTHSYARAITRACRKAGVTPWSPNRLRHNRASEIRAQFGLDAAQVILGHSEADTTQIYAEADQKRALAIVEQIG